jgi:hypothetical protein
MRESCTWGSVRGASSDGRFYGDTVRSSRGLKGPEGRGSPDET